MNVLVIGNGGREHAVIQALAKSPKVDKIYAMKGNAGIAELAELVNVDYCDVKAVGEWVDAHKDVDFTVVTPDDPLALGLVDELERRGHRAFGPRKNAAIIEASKAFSKELTIKTSYLNPHTIGRALQLLAREDFGADEIIHTVISMEEAAKEFQAPNHTGGGKVLVAVDPTLE